MVLSNAIFIKGTNLQFVVVGAKTLIVEHKANLINILGVKPPILKLSYAAIHKIQCLRRTKTPLENHEF